MKSAAIRLMCSLVIAGLVPATHETSGLGPSPVMTGRASLYSPSTRAEARGVGARNARRVGCLRKEDEERDARSRDNSDMCLAPSPGSQVNQDSAQAWTS